MPDETVAPRESGMAAPAATAVRIVYTNYRGETAQRTVIPDNFWFGETEWHRGSQWFMDAYDIDRHAIRSFALADVKSWSPASDAARASIIAVCAPH